MWAYQVQELADGSKTLKLGDFGLATLADKPLYAVCGTPTYIAPEVLAEVGSVYYTFTYVNNNNKASTSMYLLTFRVRVMLP